jgi:hypothetical protein
MHLQKVLEVMSTSIYRGLNPFDFIHKHFSADLRGNILKIQCGTVWYVQCGTVWYVQCIQKVTVQLYLRGATNLQCIVIAHARLMS